jgi:superfamily II DNA helicase RecQ
MLAKLTTHQKTVLESIEGLKANEQAEQTELERAQALVAKLELQRQQALQTYKAANVVLNNLTTQLGNICKTQNQTLQELDEFNTILTLVKRQQHEANVQRVQTIIKGLRARVADLSLQSAKSQQGKNQQLEQVTQLEKQNRLASQAHQRATTQLDNQTKALRNAQHELKIYTSISNNLAIILQKLYANPLEYRNELLGSYNVVKQVIKHKRDTPPTTCILLIMTFLYRNNKDMLEQLATSQAHTQLGMNELEKLSEDLEICCALVLPNGELNARVLKIYPPELEKWWDMYKKNNTRVWIESTGSLQNKKFDGNHYVTHDFNERIEAFGKLIKPL